MSEIDIETGAIEFEEWDRSDDEASSFESTAEAKPTLTPRFFTSKIKSKKNASKHQSLGSNVEWSDYVKHESNHLIKKSKKRGRWTSFYSTIFTYLNDTTNMYIIFFSLATFIVTSIKDSYELSDYILIALAGVATTLESAQTLFKYKKRSIYFKQASLQYKRIYRKLTKYLYTSSTENMAEYLSLAYQDFDKLALNDHRANFNKFNKSYAVGITKPKKETLYS